jgi:multidrug efflux pump subunit AcrB
MQLEDKLSAIPEVKYYLTYAGGTTAYEGRIKVQLYDRKDRSRSVWQVANDMRAFAAQFKDADIRVSETQTSVAGISGGGGKGGSGALQIELRGNDNEALIAASERVQKLLSTEIQGVSDVNSSYTEVEFKTEAESQTDEGELETEAEPRTKAVKPANKSRETKKK